MDVKKKKYVENELTNTQKLYKKFLSYYLFDMLGVPNLCKNKFMDEPFINEKIENENRNVIIQDNKTYFCMYGRKLFKIDYDINSHNIEWVDLIIDAFFKIVKVNSYFFEKNTSNNNLVHFFYDLKSTDNKMDFIKSYKSKYEKELFSFAIERGLINWIVSGNNADNKYRLKIEELLNVLENWSSKTYEGHNVCYGILVDPNANVEVNESKVIDNFIDFLDDEYSATLSDGITSLLEINMNGDLIGYKSILKNNIIEECNFDDSVLPYRFAQTIINYVVDNKVGIFLLQNGDIILAKNKIIYFVKRNGKWLNFQYSTFENIVKREIQKDDAMISKILKSCFSTCIDVSLAHTGGIIAMITDKDNQEFRSIFSEIDEINDTDENELYYKEIATKLSKDKSSQDINSMLEELESKYPADYKKIKKDIIKRLTKRNVIKNLVRDCEGNYLKYFEIDRKLRSELTGLDGATILDSKGNIISFGSIIKNTPGSSGGGRGAAAKTLSKFGGFAIKISTDGYIEVFVNENRIYYIK